VADTPRLVDCSVFAALIIVAQTRVRTVDPSRVVGIGGGYVRKVFAWLEVFVNEFDIHNLFSEFSPAFDKEFFGTLRLTKGIAFSHLFNCG
jgi:hypothetical protein